MVRRHEDARGNAVYGEQVRETSIVESLCCIKVPVAYVFELLGLAAVIAAWGFVPSSGDGTKDGVASGCSATCTAIAALRPSAFQFHVRRPDEKWLMMNGICELGTGKSG